MNRNEQWVIKTVVPEDVYTDRSEFIDFYYNAALNAIDRRTMSSVLLGQRRMGKTEIFKRVVNRLFFEQDHKDPNAAIPVYFKFPDEVIDRRDFALNYVENFIRWFAAFRADDKKLLSEPKGLQALIELIENRIEISKGFHIALDLIRAIDEDDVVLPEEKAVGLPREVSDLDDITIVMFLDEFQNTRTPPPGISVAGFYQDAVESPTCPHFVTGSALSVLADDILGKGALYGRFDYERIEPFTDYWGSALALKAANYYKAKLPEIMAPVVSDRCGGNPFYITAVIRQAAKKNRSVDDEATLNKLLAVDISAGFIYAELSEQVNRWIKYVNKYNITKWILYLAAVERGNEINLERIQKDLYERERIKVPISEIKTVLIRLSRGDLLEYKSFGNWFGKINDPILNEFLKVWGEIEIERQTPLYVEEKTVKKFKKITKRFNNYKGYLAEIYMLQILWNTQGKTLPGRFFNRKEDLEMPDRFYYIDQRHRPGAGEKMEVDIYGGAGNEKWLAESKWWDNRKVGSDVVNHLLAQAEIVKEREGEDLETLRLWLFAHDGVTGPARELMKERGILWSTRAELDGLLETARLRKLPALD